MRIKMILLLVAIVSFVSFGARIAGFQQAARNSEIGVGGMSWDNFFRDLSQRYYGTTEFAEELALVNRSLRFCSLEKIKNTDLIIPDRESIARLHERQTMKIVSDEKPTLAFHPQHQSINWFAMQLLLFFISLNQMVLPLLVGAVALILLVKLFLAFRAGNVKNMGSASPERKFAKSSDRILVEFDVTQLEKKK